MVISVFFVGNDSSSLGYLRQQLAREAIYNIYPGTFSYEETIEKLYFLHGPQYGPSILVIDLQSNPEKACWLAENIKQTHLKAHLVMMSSGRDPETILRAIKAGAEEFLIEPFIDKEVISAFEAIRKTIRVKEAHGAKRGKFIAVTSNKGGVGTTTVATNIATKLVDKNRSVCLVDLVLQFGSIASFLSLDSSQTNPNLIETIRRNKPSSLEKFLLKHSSGLRVLAESFGDADARRITPAEIDEVLDILAYSFDFVVIDAPKEFDDVLTLVLDKADIVLFVTEMDFPSLRSAVRAFDYFKKMSVDNRKTRLLLNRYVTSKLMNQEAVEKVLGMKVFWTLPNNYPVAVAAVNQGMPIEECDDGSDIAKSFAGLTNAVLRIFTMQNGRGDESENQRSPGVFERWLKAGGLIK